MRRLIVVLLTLALLMTGALPAAAAAGGRIVLDGEQTTVAMDADTGFVALDQLAKTIGAEYTWVAERREATVVLGHRSVVLWADSPKAVFNGAFRTLAAAPVLSGNTVLAPAVAVAEALGLYVAGEKDGALMVRTGLDLITSAKATDFTSDRMMSSRMLVEMNTAGVGEWEDSKPSGTSMTSDFHIYKGQLMVKMRLERPSDPPRTLVAVYMDGKSYFKEDDEDWEISDEPTSPFDQEIPAELAALWAPAAPNSAELKDAVITVTGTSEMDGVKVVHVMVSSTRPTTMPSGMSERLVTGLSGSFNVSRRVQTYTIDPETGIVHEAHTEISYSISRGYLNSDLRSVADYRVNPASVPIELPADFPR